MVETRNINSFRIAYIGDFRLKKEKLQCKTRQLYVSSFVGIYMRNIEKKITFIYTDKLEYQCEEPIAIEAKKRGYTVNFTDNIFAKCEIGFYCQHFCYPENSKLSCVMLHDLGQQHGYWPNMWQNEFWNHFDIGFLPSKEWCEMWYESSCFDFSNPRIGCFFSGWPKSDNIYEKFFDEECKKIIKEYAIDTSKKTILYAPSWEYDGRQLEIIEACKGLDVNLIIKQFPWNPDENAVFKYQYDLCNEMSQKSQGIENVFVLDPSINIFNAINICDLLVSEESSTLYEAMMLDKPVIAVTDWLVPDNLPNPPRFPDFPYEFAVHANKSELKEVISNVVNDVSYTEKISRYRKENFPNIGYAAKTIVDTIDNVLNENMISNKLKGKEIIKTPRYFKKTIHNRKKMMKKIEIRMKYIDKSKILTFIYDVLRNLKK